MTYLYCKLSHFDNSCVKYSNVLESDIGAYSYEELKFKWLYPGGCYSESILFLTFGDCFGLLNLA